MMNVTQMFRCPIGRDFVIGIRQQQRQALRNIAPSKRWWIEAQFDCQCRARR
jgi:hypothetical protein